MVSICAHSSSDSFKTLFPLLFLVHLSPVDREDMVPSPPETGPENDATSSRDSADKDGSILSCQSSTQDRRY
ncbi:MAG: hypothetical protein K6A76_07690 [Oribacterium sp.]|nr:hypothetical protein [Oribacterium sp.]